MFRWRRSRDLDPDRDTVRRGEPLGEVYLFDPPSYDGPSGFDPAARSRALQRLDPNGVPLVPAQPFLTDCHLGESFGGRDESEYLAILDHLFGRRDVHQVLAEISGGRGDRPRSHTLYVITSASPTQVMAWFDADEVDRLGPKTALVRELTARSEVPIGFSVIRAHWAAAESRPASPSG